MPLNPVRITRGLETSDASAYSPITTLRKMKGAIYTQASFVVKKALGRTLFSRAPAGGTSQSIAILDFNLTDDQIYMQAGTNVYIAPAGETGSFVTLKEQVLLPVISTAISFPTAAPQNLVSARIGDAWVIANGSGFPTLVENNLKARRIGIQTPTSVIQITGADLLSETVRANTASTSFSVFIGRQAGGSPIPGGLVQGEAFFHRLRGAFDRTTATLKNTHTNFGIKEKSALFFVGSSGVASVIYEFTNTTPVTNLFLTSTIAFKTKSGKRGARPQIDVSTNSGGTFVTVWNGISSTNTRLPIQNNIGSTNASRVQVRFRIVARLPAEPSSMQIYDINLDPGGVIGTFSTANLGFRYLYTYIRKYHRISSDGAEVAIGIESDPSIPTPDLSLLPHTFNTVSGVLLQFEERTAANVTHRAIYRTTDVVTVEQSRTIDEFFKIGEMPIRDRTFFDRVADVGFPVDFIGGIEHPPFLVVGGLVRQSNVPPPRDTAVVGSFGGSILYAADDDDGIFYWSRPLPFGSPDYVPPDYSDILPGAPTAFLDIGLSLAFTPRSVHAYSFFPLASDAGFSPGRVKVPISTTHGCISKQGATIFQSAQGQQLAAFVAGDGIYVTDGSRLVEISKGLDWKNTVDVASLPSAQLHNDPTNKKLLFVYKDNDGTTQKIDVNYEDDFKFAGPQRWPDNSGGVLIQNDGVVRIYSEQDGTVYLEENGVIDNANLENSLGTITWEIETPQIYPFLPGGKGVLKGVFVDIDKEIGSDIEVIVFYRIDTGNEKELSNKFTLTTDGWKEAVAINEQCESFRVVMKSTSPNFPGLNAWTAATDQTDDIFLTRLTEPSK